MANLGAMRNGDGGGGVVFEELFGPLPAGHFKARNGAVGPGNLGYINWEGVAIGYATIA